jgi:peptidoglycan/LPS O-acetylase OafA/YrhL
MHINPRLSFMFFIGASAFVFKEKIRLSPTAAWLCVAALSCAVAQKSQFKFFWMAVLAYLLLAAAFLPSGVVRKYNLLGDYSYGVYIYAWPVQQAIKTLRPGISIGGMIAISTSVTLALSILSWHLVEKRMLAKKARCVEWTRRIITRNVPMGDIG